MHWKRSLRTDLPEAYAASSAAWCLVGAILATIGLAQIALGVGAPTAEFAVGRLHEAFVVVMVFGVLMLAPAGFLLGAAAKSALDPERLEAAPKSGWTLVLWNGGVLLAVAAILLGYGGPVPWQAAPPLSLILIMAGAVAWGRAIWRAADRPASDSGLPAWMAMAVPTALTIPVFVAVMALAGAGLRGAPQELATTVGMRGYLALGILPLLWAACAKRVTDAAGRELYGRALPFIGFVGWLGIAALATPAPVVPDLAPPWVGPLATVCAAIAVVPLLLLTTGLVGTWIGARRTRGSAEAVLATAGLLLASAALATDALLVAEARATLRFTTADPWSVLFPPFAGAALLAMAVSSGAARGRREAVAFMWLAAVAALLGVAALWPLGFTEAVAGPTGATDRAGALMRLPWAACLALAAVAWLRRATSDSALSGSQAESGTTPGADAPSLDAPSFDARNGAGQRLWPGRVPMAAAALVVVVMSLFLTVFLPIADPSATADSPRTTARELADPLRARGSAVYTRDGCTACHTQRVLARDEARGLGPATTRADYGAGSPALAGARRGGPDLAWIGDRLPTADLMAARLAVHAPGGAAVPHPWLFGAGARDDAEALNAYLRGLRSGEVP